MWVISIILLCASAVSSSDVPAERIGGGAVVSIEAYPFATSLLYNPGDGQFDHRCGGTILTATAILSAASCFYTGTIAHDVGSWRARVGSSYSNSGGLLYVIGRITPHTDFNPTTRINDIAVIRTRFNIEFQTGVAEAARLVGRTYTFTTDQVVQIIGWGATSSSVATPSVQLRQTAVWIINQQTCANRYNELSFTLTDNMVCAGWLDVGVRGQCQGDNGGPLLDNGSVVGVFSWAEGCAQGRFPGVNTRLSPYLQWIISTATSALTV